MFAAMHSDNQRSSLPFWPFIILDVLFLGIAVLIFKNTPRPLPTMDSVVIVACVAGAAISFAIPFLRRNLEDTALAQAEAMANTVKELQKLEAVSQQINCATTQWQGVQEHATKTVDSAREMADSMAAEAKSFVEFMKKANEGEKAHLRVEVDKLRRAEGQWLEVLVRIMDNVYALNQAALQSGKANLINQIGQFHKACCDSSRRVGLIPFVAEPGAAYDEKAQDLFEGEKPSEGAKVAQTVACGYSFQGQLVRKPVVMLASEKIEETEEVSPAQDVLPGLAS
jgi:hypothetical protein